jgi:hypothetical protein
VAACNTSIFGQPCWVTPSRQATAWGGHFPSIYLASSFFLQPWPKCLLSH